MAARHYFLESRHPEVTKNSYYVLSREGSQEKESAPGLKVFYIKLFYNIAVLNFYSKSLQSTYVGIHF